MEFSVPTNFFANSNLSSKGPEEWLDVREGGGRKEGGGRRGGRREEGGGRREEGGGRREEIGGRRRDGGRDEGGKY
jgi:hypothetical protein